MDLGQLRYFQKIVEHGSFTKAAKSCTVSQPALSQQIAKLEKELGQSLFERQGRPARLTPAGQMLQGEAEKILHLVDDLKRKITDDGMNGRICVSAIPTIAPYMLPQILAEVGSQFPLASFQISEDTTDVLLKKCINGDVDLGILALPVAAKSLTVEPLFQEELLVGMPAGHRLASREKVSISDVRKETFVLMRDTHCLVNTIERFCHRKKFQPVASSRIEQLSTVQHLIGKGQGISFVPKMATVDDLDGSVVYVPMKGETPSREIALCWNPYRYHSQLLGNFIKGIRERFGADLLKKPESNGRRPKPAPANAVLDS